MKPDKLGFAHQECPQLRKSPRFSSSVREGSTREASMSPEKVHNTHESQLPTSPSKNSLSLPSLLQAVSFPVRSFTPETIDLTE
jgi:hypothetical protein